MTALAIVDSLPGAIAALAAYPDAMLASDNPLLAADPRAPVPIENLDAMITAEEAYQIGFRSVRLAIEADQQLASNPELLALAGKPVSLCGHSTRTFASLIYRASILARALERLRPSAVHVYAATAPLHEPRAPVLPSRFLSPAAPLIELGFFGKIPATVTRIPVDIPEVNNTAIKDVMRRAAMLPLSVLLMEAWARIESGRKSPFDFLLYGNNDAIREALPFLALRRLRWRSAGLQPSADSAECMALGDAMERAIADRHMDWLSSGVTAAGSTFSPQQASSIARLLSRYLAAGLATTAASRDSVQKWLVGQFSGCRRQRRILVTAGLFGPQGALLHSMAKQHGITVVTFEHGVTKGLAALSAARPEASEVKLTDWFLGCAPNAMREYGQDLDSGRFRFRAIGLPDHMKRLLRRPIQRVLARRALGLRRGKPVLMHIATWPYHGNHRSGPGVPPETSVLDIDRTLLQMVYPDLPYRVFFKPYPTQRFIHEPHYRSLFKIADDVGFIDEQDFRYVRAAADVIVTTNPTSTLGWCVGTGVPLVWLDSRWLTPLASDDLRRKFREAFIVVNIDVPTWPQELRAMLRRDLNSVAAEWRAKGSARKALLELAITGPQGSCGRRGAAAVNEALRA